MEISNNTTIKLDNGTEIILTETEARQIYNHLHSLFGSTFNPYPVYPQYPTHPYYTYPNIHYTNDFTSNTISIDEK